MQAVKLGDRVQVHYKKRFDDGSWASSHKRGPLELVAGVAHPRLPGLGLSLVGLTPGQVASLRVSPEKAYGVSDVAKVRDVPRSLLPEGVGVGDRVLLGPAKGKQQRVRVLELHGDSAVVDANHRWAGMTMELRVEVIEVCGTEPRSASE